MIFFLVREEKKVLCPLCRGLSLSIPLGKDFRRINEIVVSADLVSD